MFNNLYSRLTGKVNYKILIFVPIIISVLMVILLLTRGIPMGIDFQGGTLMEILTDKDIDQLTLSELEDDLLNLGLKDLKIYLGSDFETGMNRVTVFTTSVVETGDVEGIIAKYLGELRESDTALIELTQKPPAELGDKLSVRLKERIDIKFDEESNILKISAIDLDKEELENALGFYLDQEVAIDLQKKNCNIGKVEPALGEKFREDGVKAAILAYILMASVIFFAFRDFIPSIAVMLAATCDALIAAGGMSLFGILLEPASLVALLMLVGYSVDSDILLTTRVLRRKTGEVNKRIDNAMKTGLTMTGTTIAVMLVILFISSTLTQIHTLSSIASVLLLGLFADLITTWFMNAGMLKWYIEEKGGKFTILKRKRRMKRSYR
jgi:preprotein translocase subunit SecF